MDPRFGSLIGVRGAATACLVLGVILVGFTTHGCGLWFVVCGVWYVVCDMWCVEKLDDDDYGFSAEVYVNDRKQVLIMANLIEAIRLWLGEFLNRDPYAGIKLILDDEEGIIAHINE